MKAVRFTRHGKPDVLTVNDIPTPVANQVEALVRVKAASINPSDVKNVQGLMEQTTLPRTPGRDTDVVLDCVGGTMFRHALDCLAPKGHLIQMSVTGVREVTFNLADFYHNESRLIGIDTLKLDLTGSAAILAQRAAGFQVGDYRPSPIAKRFPLADAVAAYQAVAAGQPGRMVLLP